MGQSNV